MHATCVLPSELTIYTVGELYPQCLAWLDAATTEAGEAPVLRLEAQSVNDVDAAGVQLLLSLGNALRTRHWQLQLAAPSRALSDACHALGAACLMSNSELEEFTP